jgi:hypothetical protein
MRKNNTIIQLVAIITVGMMIQSGACKKDDSLDNPIIGTPGQANGIIFFDKGMYSDGWRYMEIMPFDVGTTPNAVSWGCHNVLLSGCGGEDIGTGLQNTQEILQGQIANSCGSSGTPDQNAALLCDNYSFNGYSDWFLPSKKELDKALEMFKNKNIGSIGSTGSLYWTSTQVNIPLYNPSTGNDVLGEKAVSLRVFLEEDVFGYIGELQLSKGSGARIRPVRRY